MAIVAAGIVIGYDWQSELRFKVRLDIYSHTTENSASGVLTEQSFSVEDSEGLVNSGIYTFVIDYITRPVEEGGWGMTLAVDDTVEIINPYQKASVAVVLSNRCTAFWSFNDETGTDSVGQNHLTAVGAVSYFDGKLGLAVSVDVASGYLTITNSPDVVLGDFDFTLAFWVQPQDPIGEGVDGPILSFRNIALNRAVLELWRRAADGVLELRNQDGPMFETTLVAPGDVWNFVILSYEAHDPPDGYGDFTVRLNMQPAQAATDAVALLTDGDRFSIGASGETSPVMFFGEVDALGFYRYIPTEAGIVTLFNNGEGQEHPFEESLALPLPYGTGLVHVTTASQIATASLLKDADIADDTIALSRLAFIGQGYLVGSATGGTGAVEALPISYALDFLAGAADGDMIVRIDGVWTVIHKGTAGQVLTMNAGGTAPEWV